MTTRTISTTSAITKILTNPETCPTMETDIQCIFAVQDFVGRPGYVPHRKQFQESDFESMFTYLKRHSFPLQFFIVSLWIREAEKQGVRLQESPVFIQWVLKTWHPWAGIRETGLDGQDGDL